MYCENCGKELNENKYCTECSRTNNNYFNNSKNIDTANDKPSIGLNILSFFWPLIGLILFICMKNDSPAKAKSCGISALISFILRIVLVIISIIFLAIFTYSEIDNGNLNNIKETIEENFDNHYYEDDDIYTFESILTYYASLAKGKFYEDIYSDNNITTKCYSINDLAPSIYYKGSIELNFNDEKLNIKIWLTDNTYYVEGINYSDYTSNEIKQGNKSTTTCSASYTNSL